MDEQGFKKVLDEALTPLREDIKDLKKDVSGLKEDVGELKLDVNELKDDVSVLKDDVNKLKEDVTTLKGSVMAIEKTTTSYADSYKINQQNIERLDSRTIAIEENLQIDPPEDLKIQHFS